MYPTNGYNNGVPYCGDATMGSGSFGSDNNDNTYLSNISSGSDAFGYSYSEPTAPAAKRPRYDTYSNDMSQAMANRPHYNTYHNDTTQSYQNYQWPEYNYQMDQYTTNQYNPDQYNPNQYCQWPQTQPQPQGYENYQYNNGTYEPFPPQAQNTPMAPTSYQPVGGTSTSMTDIVNTFDNTVNNQPPQPMNDLPDWQKVFATIPGRLSLHGNYKIIVPVAEIKRRIGKPEMNNQSLIAAMLRKAKSKESGELVLKSLAEHGITLNLGRRKSAPITRFTSLCEDEIRQLIDDHKLIMDKNFGFLKMAIAYESMCQTRTVEEFEQKKFAFFTAKQMMSFFLQKLNEDTSPVCDRPTNIVSRLHPQTSDHFNHYSLLTHGFGNAFMKQSWETLSGIVNECYEAFNDPKTFLDKIQLAPPQIYTLMTYGRGYGDPYGGGI